MERERHADDGELMHTTGDPQREQPGFRWTHPSCAPIEELLKHCHVGAARASGGPGGQHRNKVQTQVFVRHEPTGIETHADERRSQSENKAMAVRRMRLALAVAVRMPVPIGEIGSGLWKSRVRRGPDGKGRIGCSPEHEDYPAMLAEALDVLNACKWDPVRAGLRLGCSGSQLVKLVKEHAPAMLLLNEQRRERGERELK